MQFNPNAENLGPNEVLRLRNNRLYKEAASVRQNSSIFWKFYTRSEYDQKAIFHRIQDSVESALSRNEIRSESQLQSEFTAVKNLSQTITILRNQANAHNQERAKRFSLIRWLFIQHIDLAPYQRALNSLENPATRYIARLQPSVTKLKAQENPDLKWADTLKHQLNLLKTVAPSSSEFIDALVSSITEACDTTQKTHLKENAQRLQKALQKIQTEVSQAKYLMMLFSPTSELNDLEIPIKSHSKLAERLYGTMNPKEIPQVAENAKTYETLLRNVMAKKEQLLSAERVRVVELPETTAYECDVKFYQLDNLQRNYGVSFDETMLQALRKKKMEFQSAERQAQEKHAQEVYVAKVAKANVNREEKIESISEKLNRIINAANDPWADYPKLLRSFKKCDENFTQYYHTENLDSKFRKATEALFNIYLARGGLLSGLPQPPTKYADPSRLIGHMFALYHALKGRGY